MTHLNMRFAEICKHGGVRGHLSTSQLALPLTTINGFTTMAPNLALATHELTQNIINSKLQGDKVPNDDDVAKIGLCTARTVRYHRSNMHLYRSTKAPSNGAGRPRTITPPMLTALCAQLAVDPCMRLRDMATFLGAEFDVDVTRFSISRALRDAGGQRKLHKMLLASVAKIYETNTCTKYRTFRSDQLVFIDESGVDRSIGIERKGWAPRGKRPRQVKHFHRCRVLQSHDLPTLFGAT